MGRQEVRIPIGRHSVTAWRRDDGVIAALGLVYAHAERFERSHLVPPSGDALEPGAQCPQVSGPLEAMLGGADIAMDEHCLSLSVWTPGLEGRRPVLVWIHGGAFVTGTGAMPWYDGAALAARGDVVVVSINYRLGAWGFLGDRNCGLWDQIRALEWVQTHIERFGGDPSAVTVFGESAGGASVVTLLAHPAAEGLFRAAWAMSPSIRQLRGQQRAEEVARRLVDLAGVRSVADLRDVPPDVILGAQATILRDRVAGFDAFSPTAGVDGLPESITAAAAVNPTPLVIGTTRDEMLLFAVMDPASATLDDDTVRTRVLDIVDSAAVTDADRLLETYRRHRPGATPVELLSAVTTDQTFRVPAQRLTERRVANGCPTWTTWFTWPSPAFGGLGACHGLDIPFAFHNLDQRGVTRFTGEAPERAAVADGHADALLAFARSGAAPWRPHTLTERPTLRIDAVTEEIPDPEPDLRALWGDGPVGA